MESTTTVEGSTIRDTLEELERADDEATLDELRLSEDDETTLDELRLVEDEDCSFFYSTMTFFCQSSILQNCCLTIFLFLPKTKIEQR